MIRYEVFHRAVCTNCGHVAARNKDVAFLSPFFLPDHCEGCGEYRSGSPHWNDDWRTETVKNRLVKDRFHPLKPSTWFERLERVSVE